MTENSIFVSVNDKRFFFLPLMEGITPGFYNSLSSAKQEGLGIAGFSTIRCKPTVIPKVAISDLMYEMKKVSKSVTPK